MLAPLVTVRNALQDIASGEGDLTRRLQVHGRDELSDIGHAFNSFTEKIAAVLLRIRDDGKTLLMIEHDVKLVMGICDRLMVLDYGKTLTSGTPDSVRRDPAVIAAWLGGSAHV